MLVLGAEDRYQNSEKNEAGALGGGHGAGVGSVLRCLLGGVNLDRLSGFGRFSVFFVGGGEAIFNFSKAD